MEMLLQYLGILFARSSESKVFLNIWIKEKSAISHTNQEYTMVSNFL